MTIGTFLFENFRLDPANRQLRRNGDPVELNSRYLDALALLVREQGSLVSKDRFLAEVWRGVPVTDEALTQCIRTLRKQLGDDAASPRFIETIPKHGYRFIAPVEAVGYNAEVGIAGDPGPAASAGWSWREAVPLGLAGMLGGAAAGIVGGLFYGFAAASQPLDGGMGAVSVLLVLLLISFVVALLGAAGVSFGIAAALVISRRPGLWSIAGGLIGGAFVGALVKLLGVDAFQLFLGQSPGDITGAAEGALLGAAVGFGAWAANRLATASSLRRGVVAAAMASGAAGALLSLSGGRLMGGSLDLVARHFPNSRLRLDSVGVLFGESGFGPLTQATTASLEGALFGGCIVAAMGLAQRNLANRRG